MAKNGQEPSLTSLMSDDLKRSVNLTGPLVHFCIRLTFGGPGHSLLSVILSGSFNYL